MILLILLQECKKVVRKIYIKRALNNEKEIVIGECRLKYIFKRKIKSNKLMIVFSGFAPKNKPAAYNYLWSFRHIKCSKLYILDNFGYNFRGAFYLGKNRDSSIADAVTELINRIQYKYSITNDNIITVGSSKGGFASLFCF